MATKKLPAGFVLRLTSDFPEGFLNQSPSELELYGKDSSRVLTPHASAVVFPRTTDEVSRFLKLCNEQGVAVVPSGGRTGLAGGAIAANGEIVLSLSRMNKMGIVDPLSQTVRVQAGAITEAVHQHCAPLGLTWPVDFASKGSSHVGGNISTNAGGVKVIHYGVARQWVLGLQVVTMSGDILELNGALEKNNTGVDLRQVFIGTEGTLGVVTEAVLKLTRLPGTADVFFFAVANIPAVLKLFHEVRRAPFSVMAFECLTRNCLETVSQVRGIKPPFDELSEAYVLLEIERPVTGDTQTLLDQWLAGLFEKGLVLNGTLAQSPREAKDLWSLREGISESLAHIGFMHKNDISLPIAQLEDFVADMYSLFAKKHGDFEVFLFGHIGDGNLHINTKKPEAVSKEDFMRRCHKADEDLFALVQKYKGSVSAEHGIGLLKKAALHFSRTPVELEIFKKMKAVFDPKNLLNPGKIFD